MAAAAAEMKENERWVVVIWGLWWRKTAGEDK